MINGSDPTFVQGSVLSTVFEPMDIAEFLERYWQRESVVLGGRSPDHFDSIFSIDSIDSLLTNCTIPAGNIDMGSNAVGADPASYKPKGVADSASLLKLHKAGETIILRAMHLFDGGLRQLCAALSSVFRCNAQANIYITPAKTRSSYPHWDAHDIFILQVAGTKVWTLHENALALPHPDFRFDPNQHPIGDPIGEIEMKPGDTAYIPRGLAHNPHAIDHSVHISLGVQVITWYDVLVAALQQACGSTEAVRRAVPLARGGLGVDPSAIEAELGSLLSDTFDSDTVLGRAQSLLDRAAQQQIATDTAGMLQAIVNGQGVRAESVVELRTILPSRSSARIAGTTRVLLSGLEFAVDPTHTAMADFIVERRRFRAEELPGEDVAAKVAFVEHLVDEGCLRIVS